jgi:hypothetical protein
MATRVTTQRSEIAGPWPHTALEGRVLRLDGDAFSVALPSRWEHFIDPRLRETLAPWGIRAPEEVPLWRRWKEEGGRVVAVSLDHAWAAAAWARAGAGGPLTVAHLDRHTDCGAPLLLLDGEGGMWDCLTGSPVRAEDPGSLESAIASGAIGVGGFVAPAVASGLVRRVLHVLPSRTPLAPGRARALAVGPGAPHPRRPDLRWLAASLDEGVQALRRAPYLAAHADTLPDHVEGPVVLDVDLDYGSNRYRGDPDWHGTPGPELPAEAFAAEVGAVLDRLEPKRIVCITVATSPGYCPAESWRPLLEALSDTLAARVGASLDGLLPWPEG